jgi:hypothetical protein
MAMRIEKQIHLEPGAVKKLFGLTAMIIDFHPMANSIRGPISQIFAADTLMGGLTVE